MTTAGASRSEWHLPEALASAHAAALRAWEIVRGSARLWRRDPSLWTGGDEARWLGWLDIAERQTRHLGELEAFGREIRAAGFADALLLGMGGSSLGPEVISTLFASADGYPRLHVLDSTDPQQVRNAAARTRPQTTLHIVSSKSGSTLEPHILMERFWHDAQEATGGHAGERFVAVTDPGSKLETLARERGFRRVFHGVPEIGGRYSVMSNFGLVPAAACGIHVAQLVERALAMTQACGPLVPAAENPGVRLGVLLGEAAKQGRDKLTLIASPPLWDLGAWLEQLVAESTGKLGKAVLPVACERLAPPDRYDDDRFFVHLRLDGEAERVQEAALDALARAGHPVVTLHLADRFDVAGEFVRWEFATAVAGSVLGIHPFDQPDVEASKIETRKLTDAYEALGSLPSEAPILEADGLRVYADRRNVDELMASGPGPALTLASLLSSHLGRIHRGDYFAILAYLEMNPRHRDLLQTLRHRVRDRKRVATCLGFGPRFLHSTGQAYKGGPNTGVFLQLTCDDAQDLEVPGRRYTFGWSRRPRRGEISRCSPIAAAGLCASICRPTSRAAWRLSRLPSRRLSLEVGILRMKSAGASASLYRRIYSVVARIPRGKVATYGQIAALAGLPRHARMVGQALHASPEDSDLPWQRVINSQGEISLRAMPGWDGFQRHLLENEGVRFEARGRVDLRRYQWDPDLERAAGRSATKAPIRSRPLAVSWELPAIAERLRPLGTPARAAGSKAYLKSDLEFYGLTMPALRSEAKVWLRAHPELSRKDLGKLAAALFRRRAFELRAFAVELLVARQKLLTAGDLDMLEDLLRRSQTWALVDAIAPQVVGPLAEREPAVGRRLDRWASDRDFWLRRAALLTLLVPLRRGGGDWQRFARYADAMLDEKEFFIRKAIGWMLREIGKGRPALVVRFLEPRLDRVSGLTLREAVKYLPAADRKRLTR